MDSLLQKATDLAKQGSTPYRPIPGRVAYVVSHGQSYASNGYAIRTQGIAKALNEHGLETLCFVRQGRPWDLGVSSESITPEMNIDGVRYIHTRWPNNNKPKTNEEKLLAGADALEQLFRVYRPSAVLAGSNFLAGLPAWVAAQRLGVPFHNEVRGFWELSQAAREEGFETTDRFREDAERDTFVAQQADSVFTLNEPMKQELINRGVSEQNIHIIPNGIEKLPEPKQPSATLQNELGIKSDEKVVAYIGSHTEYEGLELLFDACESLVKAGQPIKLLMVGDKQPLTHPTKKTINSQDVPWLIQTGRIPHEHMADYYALADVVVIPRKNLPVCQIVPPIKVVEALSYRKSLVLSDIAPLKPYAEAFPAVTSFQAGSSAALAEAIQTALVKGDQSGGDIESLRFSYSVAPMAQLLGGEPAIEAQKNNDIKPQAPEPNRSMATPDVVDIDRRDIMLNGNQKKELAELEVPTSKSTISLSATVVYRLRTTHKTRKAVVLIDFYDASGEKLKDVPSIGLSAAFKKHFRYLNANSKSVDGRLLEVFRLKLPQNVKRIKIAVASLGLQNDEHIDIRIEGRCFDEEAEKERKRQLLKRQSLPEAVVHDPKRKRFTSDLTVACVLDEFTAECLSHEVNLIKVTQEGWQEQLEQFPPDFLLVESCWKGNDGNWGTITKGSGGGKKLSGLLRYCKQNGIPTVFWNKEDPPHYEKFGPIAKLFDVTITTDVNMVPRYKEDFGIDVYPLSFAAQPKIHNPEPVIPRLEKAVFAGSYYGDKPKRCADFNDVMNQVEQAGVAYDIFDRNFQQRIEKFAFPDHYQANIVGNLPPEEVWKAHKGYKYQVNMNSVQDSATMFARRVYESLASGTPVISNDSVGVRELFGEIVIMPGKQSIAEQLGALEASPEAYHALARCGVRTVMREHTYGHRIQALCRLLSIEVEVDLPKATLAVTARSEADIERAKQLFEAQTALRKHLFIELENFDTAYQFLNRTNDTVTYAMQLAHEFYADERQYYGTDRVLKHNVNDPLAAEALEDFLYWGAAETLAAQPQAVNRLEVSA